MRTYYKYTRVITRQQEMNKYHSISWRFDISDEGEMAFRATVCNPKDQFDKKVARMILDGEHAEIAEPVPIYRTYRHGVPMVDQAIQSLYMRPNATDTAGYCQRILDTYFLIEEEKVKKVSEDICKREVDSYLKSLTKMIVSGATLDKAREEKND